MLLPGFYKLLELNRSKETSTATIELIPTHEVYKGHFEGNSVVPGVCLIQIIKETLSIITDHELFLSNAKSIKFLNIVNPNIDNRLKLEIKTITSDDNMIKIQAVMKNDEKLFIKFSGSFQFDKDTVAN